jgi:hypothetical protein
MLWRPLPLGRGECAIVGAWAHQIFSSWIEAVQFQKVLSVCAAILAHLRWAQSPAAIAAL